MQVLKKGSTGELVKQLQTQLNQLGYNCGAVDGSFGNKTDTQVRKFQQDHHLTVDGVVGNITKQALQDALMKIDNSYIELDTNITNTVSEDATYTTYKTAKIIKVKPENVEIIVSNKTVKQTTSKNIINGTYFWEGNPNGIIVNNGNILCDNASHAWRGFGQSVIYFDGKNVGVKRVKSAKELGNVEWAIGGCGVITPYGYSPANEGFNGAYADVLRTCNKTIVGYKNGEIYLIVVPTISHGSLLKLLQEMKLTYAVSLDGGGSTVMKFNGKSIITSSRVINNWVVAK